ncbi:exonuclease domain-containing protein [Pedobacter heparinus]|uniref:DNA polymerase III, epsilon subunit n=1 Tax=Pedobacter heparinus (strain ATCC 13125 / DSM 2366 / CIP 104194 / JCM 7457 / NBRC 12017 / NCIMB 9290 / NRRL B-14731 / HIM 762-3) TaxID=485917 RepID=C6Y0E5_PEDHD|nr:exonuclease domain-containing protein [Pedobacter heparinus]ACU04857.1 DNA polymerase III, epsilon subunit [Pedobacter heparinus DSM 2366]
MLYAVVDIETTGGFASGNGITEISILVHDGREVVEAYETLINPGQEIPAYIETLTGISNEMVVTAPLFGGVAAEIYAMLHDKIFVAHNVNFDFSFIKHHLSLSGYDLRCKKLCTVRLSRKLFPGYSSYSLGKLCNALNIAIHDRHRAGGDARATAELLTLLLKTDLEGIIVQTLSRASKEQVLPPHLSRTQIDKLPQVPGVYYFRDQKGIVVYVGKAKNILKRVCSHFTGNNSGKQRQEFLKNIHSIDFEICGTELMAFILEAAEIKRLWPENNRALKRYEQKYGLYVFEDQKGYMRLGIDTYKKRVPVLYSFNSLVEGHNLLRRLIKEHKLCEKLCFIQKNRDACTGHNEGKCSGACLGIESAASYNVRVKYAIEYLSSILPTFAVIDKGRTEEEQSCLLVEQGKFYGMGYISYHTDIAGPEMLKSVLQPYPSDDYILNLISSHTTQFPQKKIAI